MMKQEKKCYNIIAYDQDFASPSQEMTSPYGQSSQNLAIDSSKNSSLYIWQKAFHLADNVRFTRTPEVELMRRRIEAQALAFAKYKSKQTPEEARFDKQNECHEQAVISQALPSTEREGNYLSDYVFFAAKEVGCTLKEVEASLSFEQAFTTKKDLPEEPAFEADITTQNTSLKTDGTVINHTALQQEKCSGYSVKGLRYRYKTNFVFYGFEKKLQKDLEEKETPSCCKSSDPLEMPTKKEESLFSLDPQEGIATSKVPGQAKLLPSQQSYKGKEFYQKPPLDFLQQVEKSENNYDYDDNLERSAGLLENVLEDFGIRGDIIHVRPGPVVTLYEFEPAAGVKSSRVIGLTDDIARSMSAISARVAVIPGRNVIGIELPNLTRETVYLREILESSAFSHSKGKLSLALGKTIGGEIEIAELTKMPHLLVAGTTGSGKSVAINAMILSLLYRMSPQECRLIMVDPKMLELSIYDGIPHLLTPVVTDPKKAVTALKWAVKEMEDRYRKMAKLGVRNIDGFNARIDEALEKGETISCTVQSGFDKETGSLLYHEEKLDLVKLPYIVIIVDEMADLMMVAGKEIEGAIQRLAQMARAAGIHLIMATQRPSVDVITGTIKANFPTRISFQVTSKIDSRTILGEQGAETLLGQGDMLHMASGGRIMRIHGPFVSEQEIAKIVDYLKAQGTPDYLAHVTDSQDEEDAITEANSVAEIVASTNGSEDFEELYLQAVKIVIRDKKCSTSYIQRRLSVGYNKAASLVEKMEEEGIVGPANHVGKREILLPNID